MCEIKDEDELRDGDGNGNEKVGESGEGGKGMGISGNEGEDGGWQSRGIEGVGMRPGVKDDDTNESTNMIRLSTESGRSEDLMSGSARFIETDFKLRGVAYATQAKWKRLARRYYLTHRLGG